MNVAAIICEYNPFHNGHLHHLEAARAMIAAEFVVCVMSGAWVQRGEPAIVDKWTRARTALLCGADLVIELPAIYAVRAAADFAKGAVALIEVLNICSHLVFGSEISLSELREEMERREDPASIHAALARGESYPRAVSSDKLLHCPNAILGIEYLRALQGTKIKPIVIPRSINYASASQVRNATRAGLPFDGMMPLSACGEYRSALSLQGGPACWEQLLPLTLYTLRCSSLTDYADYRDLGEGLYNRLIRAARNNASSVQALFDAVKTKRYTHARIRRALSHILLGFAPDLLNLAPSYARVLGFRRSARDLLRRIDQQSSIPLVTKLPQKISDRLLLKDLYAQELWSLTCPLPRPARLDYANSIQIC